MSKEARSRTPVRVGQRPAARRPGSRPTSGRPAPQRHQTRRHDREERYQRLTLVLGGGVFLVVAILLGFGWYQTYVKPYRDVVLTVGSRSATMDYYIKRVKVLLPQFQNSDPQFLVQAVPEGARQQVVDDFVVLQRGTKAGVTATDTEMDAELRKSLGAIFSTGGAVDRAGVEQALRAKLQQTGFSESAYREQIRAQVLRNNVQAKLAADYPRTGPEAQYAVMQFDKEADAEKILTRLRNEEDWNDIAASVRSDPTLGAVAEFDFQPKQTIDEKLAPLLFDAKPGAYTTLVQTSDGKYTIGHLVEKDSNHPVTDDQIRALIPKLYTSWLDDQKKTLRITDKLSDGQKIFALAHAGYVPPRQSAPSVGQTRPTPVTKIETLPLGPGVATPPGGLVPPPGVSVAPGSPPAPGPTGP